MLDADSLRLAWWAIIVVLILGFVLTDGFDFGACILLPWAGRNDDEPHFIHTQQMNGPGLLPFLHAGTKFKTTFHRETFWTSVDAANQARRFATPSAAALA